MDDGTLREAGEGFRESILTAGLQLCKKGPKQQDKANSSIPQNYI
jgi:hypothetical protein